LVREKRRFFDFDSLPWQRPFKNQKKLNEVSKPLHLSTNPEISVKIAPLVSELRGLESRPLKKKYIEKTSVKYIALRQLCRAGKIKPYSCIKQGTVENCSFTTCS